MKPNFPSLIIAMLLSSVSLAQQNDNSTVKAPLSEEQFNRVINQQFTNLLTGQNVNAIGSFASLDLTEGKASATASWVFSNGHIVTTNLSGKASDGTLALIRDTELNSSFAAQFQYHFLNRGKKSVILNDTQVRNWEAKRNQIILKHQEKTEALQNRDTLITLRLSLRDKKQKQSELEKRISERGEAGLNEAQRLDQTWDKRVLKKLKKEIQDIERAIATVSSEDWVAEQLLKANNKKFEGLEKYDPAKLEVRGFDLDWFSLGLGYGYDQFKLLFPDNALPSQLKDTSGHALQFNLQYSRYRWHVAYHNTSLFTLNLSGALKNNSGNLKKRQVEEITVLGSATAERRTVDQFIAYEGDYQVWLPELTLRPDWYVFVPQKNWNSNILFGGHLYGELRFTRGLATQINTGLGLVFSFLEREGQKSQVNTELYYELRDMGNAGNSELGFFQRSELGLRFSVPFYIVNSNKK